MSHQCLALVQTFFETGSYSVAQAGLKLEILLPLPPRSWNYLWSSQHLLHTHPKFTFYVSFFTCSFLCLVHQPESFLR
jgi:hypothetical protein